MTSNIQIETNKDHVVNTTAPLRVDMSKIEIAPDEPHIARPRVEIPEKRKSRAIDSDSDASDLLYLANQKKIAPLHDLASEKDKDASSKGKEADSQHDSDDEKEKEKNKYNSDSDSHSSHKTKKSNDGDYKPRYSSEHSIGGFSHRTSNLNPLKDTKTATMSFLNSPLFSSKRDEARTPEEIREEKARLLREYESKNKDNLYSAKRLSMMNDLKEIQGELAFIKGKRQMENSMTGWKQGLMLFVNSCVMLNSYYKDPFDIDLTDWARQMNFDVNRAGMYDDVLEDLIIKWSGKVPMSPELKLVFMMGSSLFFGVLAKKNEKAALEKQAEDERRTREVAKMAAREEMARIYAQQQEMDNRRYQTMQQEHHQQRYQQPPSYQRPAQTNLQAEYLNGENRKRTPTVSMQGPSISDDVLLQFKGRMIDSTDGGDDSTIASVASKASRASKASKASSRSNGSKRSNRSAGTTKSKQEKDKEQDEAAVPAPPPHRGPGRPRKEPQQNVVAPPKRPPGRPRKNPTANNVITLSP